MPKFEAKLKAGKRSYPIRYTSNALYRMEQKLGMAAPELGKLFLADRVGFREFLTITWAGLEGGRLKAGYRSEPWTLDEVGDLVDEAGGIEVLGPVIMEAFQRSEAVSVGKDEEESPDPPAGKKAGTAGTA